MAAPPTEEEARSDDNGSDQSSTEADDDGSSSLALLAVVALVAAAAAAGRRPRLLHPAYRAWRRHPARRDAPHPAAPSDAGYTGPEATITYSIWGDPTEIKNQQAIVDAFHAANPKITVKVTVSDWEPYWDKLQTALAGGDAPDVFAMDGPLFPDYQSRDVLLDLKPYIDRDGYDLGQLADQAVADFTTPDGQFGLPRDLNVIALYYNKKLFDAAGHPLPRRYVGLGEARRGRQAAHDQGRQRQGQPSGASTPSRRTWRTTGRRLSGRTAATSSRPTRRRTSSAATRPPAGCSSSRTSSGRTRSCPTRRSGRRTAAMPSSRARQPWRPTARGSSRPTSLPGIDFGIAPLPKGPAGRATSINPTGAVVYKGTKNPDAAWAFVKYLASPAAQTKLMELKASLPANKEVLAGPFASSFDGAKVLADAIAYAHIKPSFKGYDEWTTTLQTELDANVFTEPNEDRQAGHRPTSCLSWTRSSRASDRASSPRPGPTAAMTQPPPPRSAGGAARSPATAGGPSCSLPRRCWDWPSCRRARSWQRSGSASRSGTC